MSITAKVLAVVESAPGPIEMADVVALVDDGQPHIRGRVWDSLARLARNGLLSKWKCGRRVRWRVPLAQRRASRAA